MLIIICFVYRAKVSRISLELCLRTEKGWFVWLKSLVWMEVTTEVCDWTLGICVWITSFGYTNHCVLSSRFGIGCHLSTMLYIILCLIPIPYSSNDGVKCIFTISWSFYPVWRGTMIAWVELSVSCNTLDSCICATLFIRPIFLWATMIVLIF